MKIIIIKLLLVQSKYYVAWVSVLGIYEHKGVQLQ